MNPPRLEPDTVSARRRKVRRAKRGLVASYIHEISGRHEGARVARQTAGEPAVGDAARVSA